MGILHYVQEREVLFNFFFDCLEPFRNNMGFFTILCGGKIQKSTNKLISLEDEELKSAYC